MPAPKTNTLVIPEVAPSKASPVKRDTAVPTEVDSPSANPIPASGSSHRMGERYVTISSTATTDAVTANRVMLALLIALVISAMNAGPPVTWTTRSAGVPAVAEWRSAVIALSSANPDRPAAMGIGATAARPSCEITKGGSGAPPVLGSTRCHA